MYRHMIGPNTHFFGSLHELPQHRFMLLLSVFVIVMLFCILPALLQFLVFTLVAFFF